MTLREGPFRARRTKEKDGWLIWDPSYPERFYRDDAIPRLRRLLERLEGREKARATMCNGSGSVRIHGFRSVTVSCPGCHCCQPSKPAQPTNGKQRRSGGEKTKGRTT